MHKAGPWDLRPVLPNEPRLHLPAAERALTQRHLLPVLPELETTLLAVRCQLDPELERQQLVKLGKPYPLGQCLEIAEAVHMRLRTVQESALPSNAVVGLRVLRSFQRAGGSVRQVWGDLRGQFFQNAFQVGTLYVDVANDTVTPTKPKVEILPFEQAQFGPIRDFEHFRQLARSYWGHAIYPNHVLPALAPHCPLIHVHPTGVVQLHDATQYMVALARSQAFAPSEAALREAPLPPDVFEQVCRALQHAGHKTPGSPQQGRALALQQCRQQRARRWHLEPHRPHQVIQDAQRVNRHLARWHRQYLHQESPMPSITIDNTAYDLDSLSADARVQLQSIQFVDQELARLQAQVAAMQTARMAYVNALKAALPPAQPGVPIR